jgi:hypothetical protein
MYKVIFKERSVWKRGLQSLKLAEAEMRHAISEFTTTHDSSNKIVGSVDNWSIVPDSWSITPIDLLTSQRLKKQ